MKNEDIDSKTQGLKKIVILIVFAAIIFIVFKQFNIEYIRSLVLQAGVYAPLVFMLIKILTIVLAPMSGFPMFLLAGPLFGFVKGYLYILIADFIGTTIAFHLSRKYGTKIVYRVVPKKGKKFIKKTLSSLENWRGITITRLVLPLQDVISYAAGLTKISYKEFIISSTIVKAISFALLVALGLTLLDKKTFYITIGILLAIAILIEIFRFIKNRNK